MTWPGNLVRNYRADDRPGIERLYPAAFPDEDLLPLLDRMWAAPEPPRMLVAEDAGQIIGHAALTLCHLDHGGLEISLLGPLAVHPDHQRQGIARALIELGLSSESTDGVAAVCVLGDPDFYGRFGFRTAQGLSPPYALPRDWEEAWQCWLPPGRSAPTGTLIVPDFWSDPSLWGP